MLNDPLISFTADSSIDTKQELFARAMPFLFIVFLSKSDIFISTSTLLEELNIVASVRRCCKPIFESKES
jgi:hypothetical protein